jgi:hypothetical protein
MCTVSFVPSTSGYFLTSNRDEKSTRSKALHPAIYFFNNKKIIFPKDIDKGGSWIVLKENGDSLCLLNGAFTNFIDKGNYSTSRGKIVLEIATKENLYEAFQYINLSQTAPFTLIVVMNKKLYECRWDGVEKFCSLLNNKQPHIWSSATLYDRAQQNIRTNWFNIFIANNPNPTQEDLIKFHTNSGDGDATNDLVMNRNNKYFTVSITGIECIENNYSIYYTDLITNDRSHTSFAQELAIGYQ